MTILIFLFVIFDKQKSQTILLSNEKIEAIEFKAPSYSPLARECRSSSNEVVSWSNSCQTSAKGSCVVNECPVGTHN
jgi:hypothetical protein